MVRIKCKRGDSIYYVQCKRLFSSKTTIIRMWIDPFFNLPVFYRRFVICRRCLDVEMKDPTRQGVSLQTKKREKEAVTDEDEEKFWTMQDYLAVEQLSSY